MPPAADNNSGPKMSFLFDEAKSDLRKLAGSFSMSRKVEPTDDERGINEGMKAVHFQQGTKASPTKMDFLLDEVKSDLRKFAGSLSPGGHDYGANGKDGGSGSGAQKASAKRSGSAGRDGSASAQNKTIKLSRTDSVQRGAKLQGQNSNGCGRASDENAADSVGSQMESAATDLLQTVSNLFSCGGGCAPIPSQDEADGEQGRTTGVKAESAGKDTTPEGQGTGNNAESREDVGIKAKEAITAQLAGQQSGGKNESKAKNGGRQQRRKLTNLKGLRRRLSPATVLKRKS